MQNSYYATITGSTVINWNLGTVHTISFWTKDLPVVTNTNFFSQQVYNGVDNYNGRLEWDLMNLRYYLSGTSNSVSWPRGSTTGWVNWVIIRNGTTITLYKNGISQGARTLTTNDGFTPAAFLCYFGNGINPNFNSALEEFVIYTTPKDQTWVTNQYNSGLGLYNTDTTNAFAIYHINQGSGTTLIDSSPNNRNLTITGITWTQSPVS